MDAVEAKGLDGIAQEYIRRSVTIGRDVRVIGAQEEYVAPTGYEETVLYVDGVRIKAYVKRDTPESEFYVLVLEDALGVGSYYRYDRQQQTLQRYDEERIEIRQIVEEDNSALYEALDQYKGQQVFLIFTLAMFLALSVLLLLIVVKLYRQRQSDDTDLEDRF